MRETAMGGVTSFTVDECLAPAGGIATLFADLSARFWDQPHLSAGLIELCRLALAVLHRAPAEQALRHPAASDLAQSKIDAVLGETWRRSGALSPAEKSALGFTEYYFMDPQSIPDEIAASFLAHFGDGGLVCLVEALGFIDSRIRLSLIYTALGA
jgi:alkylhydroperoxidase family enzyme